MREFWLWVTIVSLIITCILALFLLMAYMHKETRRVEMMLQRIEEVEKAKKKESKDE